MSASKKTGTGILLWRLSFAVAVVLIAPACESYECTEYRCSDLSGTSTSSETVTICDRGDGYIRLDGESGEEIYECFCDYDFMVDVAATYCSEGAVCREAGSACSASGDCCAGLFCSVGVCG